MRRAQVDWQAGLRFEARARGARIAVAPPEEGIAESSGAKELVLAGLGACTAADVSSVLAKMRQGLRAFSVEVEADEASEHPKALTAFRLRYVIEGDVDPDKAARAVALSVERYCGVMATLRKGAEITYTVEVNGQQVAGGQ